MANEDKHGPLIDFSLNYFSNGMMAGTSSSRSTKLEWNKDGTVTLTDSHSGGGNNTTCKYKVKPEVAEKLRDYVVTKDLAGLSKKDIPTVQMFDNFTSASFSMSFDDSSLGGSPYEHCHMECGPAGMTFGTLENELSAIFKECRDSGEIILQQETQTPGPFQMFFDSINKGGSTGMMNPPPAAPAPADIPAPKAPGMWTCKHCGCNENSGRFCLNCGYEKE